MAKKQKDLRDRLQAQLHDDRFRMVDVDPDSTPGLKRRKSAKRELAAAHEHLFNLQERLWAEHKRSVLIVLQGMDTSGKDGTITHVMGDMNPEGVVITTFKAPTPEEKRHGFLWRIRPRLPEPGVIGIFNRSHYEDVLIAKVHGLADLKVIERRYDQINQFEKDLVKGGTKVIKLCLHISYDEQRNRLIERLDDPNKHWKFHENDINERAFWDDYQSAYGIAITRCSTQWAPWYVIPANDKDYRNWAVSKILTEIIDEMDPQYPKPKLDIPRLKKRLQD
jgi:PPK2 family polyphosphate:nucleotide phosphotransferase